MMYYYVSSTPCSASKDMDIRIKGHPQRKTTLLAGKKYTNQHNPTEVNTYHTDYIRVSDKNPTENYAEIMPFPSTLSLRVISESHNVLKLKGWIKGLQKASKPL